VSAPTPFFALHILVVEDNETNRDVVEKILLHAGFTVDLAHNGVEALAKLELSVHTQQPYDVVLMDCQMPKMDGFATTTAWRMRERNNPGVRPIPIIALTADTLESDQQRCLAVGMNAFLAKPFSMDDLLALLQVTVGKIHERFSTDNHDHHNVAPTNKNAYNARAKDNSQKTENCAFDPAPLQRLFELTNNANVKREVIAVFKKDSSLQLQNLRDWLAKKEAHKLARAAHKFKGACLAVGLMRCAHISAQLDQAAQQHNFSLCEELFTSLKLHYYSALVLVDQATVFS
jgi:CheY-like chemotaxis protein/HPt (histidine-containing phosphotransfer) domain-containing protein